MPVYFYQDKQATSAENLRTRCETNPGFEARHSKTPEATPKKKHKNNKRCCSAQTTSENASRVLSYFGMLTSTTSSATGAAAPANMSNNELLFDSAATGGVPRPRRSTELEFYTRRCFDYVGNIQVITENTIAKKVAATMCVAIKKLWLLRHPSATARQTGPSLD